MHIFSENTDSMEAARHKTINQGLLNQMAPELKGQGWVFDAGQESLPRQTHSGKTISL